MAPLPSDYHSGGGSSSQNPSTYHQSNLDRGTEMFRQKLEEHFKAKNEKALLKAPVRGGLPPHLLRQSKQDNSTSNAQGFGTQKPDPRLRTAQMQTQPQHTQPQYTQPQHTQPQHTQPQHTQPWNAWPSKSLQTSQSQSRPSKTVTGEARRPAQAYGSRQAYGSTPKGSAPSGQQIIRQQQSRPQPAPTPPLEGFDAPAGRASSSNNAVSQQQQPPTPTYGGNTHNAPARERVVFMSARNAPGTHPALKGIMSSKWRKEVRILDVSPTQEPFPSVQGQHVVARQQSTTPQQQSSTYQPDISTPCQQWSAPGRNGGVRLSTSPYQGQQAQTTALMQQAQNAVQPEKKKKWRPKHSVDLESQSLPSSVSSFRFDDDNVSFRDVADVAGNMKMERKIAADLNLAPGGNSEGFYKKENLSPKDCHTDGEEDPYMLSLGPSNCRDWVASLPDERPPIAWIINKNFEGSEECDVEPRNGYLMAPVDYPPTHINPRDKDPAGTMSRRLGSSAKLRSAADFEKNKRRLEKAEKKSREQDLGDPASHWRPVVDPSPAPQATPAPTQTKVGDVQAHSGVHGNVGINGETAVQGQANDSASRPLAGPLTQGNNMDWVSYVKVPCFMRPAQPGDLPQVLDIYNWEVTHGIQALDNKPLCLQDMKKVFTQCRSAQTPFIVMIAGTPAEAALRKETAAPSLGPYRSHRQGAYQQSQKPEKDKVLGFGFVSTHTTGLAGDATDNVGRFQGQAYFYVANESRRNGIGRALMTRLAQCCSIYTVSMGEFEWYDPDKTAACDTVAFNARKYSRLLIETASRGRTDPDSLWLAKLLDSEHFFCVCTTDNARYVGNNDSGVWLDNLVWELDCQDLKSIRPNAKKWQ